MSYRINREIKVPDIRLVGDNAQEGNQVMSTKDAITLAEELELDLVEISPNAVPPVCKIVDYQKFLYEEKKKQKRMKANTAKVEIKEIRFTPVTDEHDIDFKTKHARKFLEDGDKVRAFVFFKGRSILFKEKGEELLLKFVQSLEDIGTAESLPQQEGKKMYIIIAPKKKK